MATFTKSIKMAIEYNKDNEIDKNDLFDIIREFRYKSFLAYNRILTYLYTNDMQNFIQKDLGIKQDDKEIYGKSFQAWIENRMNEMIEGYLSTNVAQARQFVMQRYKDDKNKGLLRGAVSLSQFKLDCPLIIHNNSYKIIETTKGLGIELGLFNMAKQKELGVKRIIFNIPKPNNSEKAILRRLIDKSYKQGSIQLKENKRKKKWEIAISYTFTNEDAVTEKENVMGIDLGITKVVTMFIYNPKTNIYEEMYWKDRCIDGTELIHHRQKIQARKRSLSIASKWSSKTKMGKGYKKRMAKANFNGDKYNRFRDTYNHKISKYIVNQAIKYKCGCIQMENLSGFSDIQSESLLRNWSYYDLQNKIKYKAAEAGIEVVLINPAYTSQRCNKCGYIDEANRECKTNQAKFECISCGYKDNADINASKNIAMPNIEEIIKEQIKYKKKLAT